MAKSSTSFEKGNHAGIATRFAPGESGNPGGRPRWKPWADAYRKFGALPIDQLAIKPTDTTIEACVKKAYQAMLKCFFLTSPFIELIWMWRGFERGPGQQARDQNDASFNS
jgi:hypothetical protein